MAAVVASLTVPKTSYLDGEVVTVTVVGRDPSRYYTRGWSVKDAAGVGMGEDSLPLPVGQTAISHTPPTAPTIGIYGQVYYTVDLHEWTSQPANPSNYADPKYVGRFSVSVIVYKSGTTVPTITTAGLKEGNPVVTAAAIGGYVQGVSALSWDIAASSPSGIASYEITIDGVLYRGKSGTSGALLTSGAKSIVTKVTDAAGATQTRTDNITVLAYTPPKVTAFNAFRSTSAGAPLETGTNIRMAFTGTVASLIVGTQKNSSSWVIKSRPLSGSYTNHSVGTGGLAPTATVTPAGFPVTTAYEVRLELSDKLTTVAAVTYVAKGGIVLDMGPNNIGVGKEWQQGTLDVGGDIYASGATYSPKLATAQSGARAELSAGQAQWYDQNGALAGEVAGWYEAGKRGLILQSVNGAGVKVGDDGVFITSGSPSLDIFLASKTSIAGGVLHDANSVAMAGRSFQAYRTSGTHTVSGTATAVAWVGTPATDLGLKMELSSRFRATVASGAMYRMDVNLRCNTANFEMIAELYKNGSQMTAAPRNLLVGGASASLGTLSGTFFFTVGAITDYWEVMVRCSAGSTTLNNETSWVTVTRVG